MTTTIGPAPRPSSAGDPGDPVDELNALLRRFDQLTATDWHAHAGTKITDALFALEQISRRVTFLESAALTVAEADGLWALDGARSLTAWLSTHRGVSKTTAARSIKLARSLRDDLPATGKALASGLISTDHSHVLARETRKTPRLQHQLRDEEAGEELLVSFATTMGAGEFTNVVKHWAILADPEGAERNWRNTTTEELFISPTTGGYHFSGWFNAASGTAITEVLRAIMGRKPKDDNRAPAQRRAAAMTELAHGWLDSGKLQPSARIRPHLTITVPYPTLHALTNAAGSPIPPPKTITNGPAIFDALRGPGAPTPTCTTCTDATPDRERGTAPPDCTTSTDAAAPEQASGADGASEGGRPPDPATSTGAGEDASSTGPDWNAPPPEWATSTDAAVDLATGASENVGPSEQTGADTGFDDPSPPGWGTSNDAATWALGTGVPTEADCETCTNTEIGAAWAKNWKDGDDHIITPAINTSMMTGHDPATLADGTPLPASVLARLVCDSTLMRVVFGADSTILDAGRTQRIFPANQTRAIIARDKHCQYPACEEGPGFGEIHHALWWYKHHGTTSTDHGILLCWWHHSLVHERDITIMRKNGQWIFTTRYGEIITNPTHTPPKTPAVLLDPTAPRWDANNTDDDSSNSGDARDDEDP